jgi:hypothetical protein
VCCIWKKIETRRSSQNKFEICSYVDKNQL